MSGPSRVNPYAAARRRAGQRNATTGTCRDCGATTLTGLDGNVLALEVTVDPTRVNAATELLARARGRPSFDLLTHGPDVELTRRFPDHLKGTPGSTRSRPVVLEHRCEDPAPPTHLQDTLWPAQTAAWTEGDPPY